MTVFLHTEWSKNIWSLQNPGNILKHPIKFKKLLNTIKLWWHFGRVVQMLRLLAHKLIHSNLKATPMWCRNIAMWLVFQPCLQRTEMWTFSSAPQVKKKSLISFTRHYSTFDWKVSQTNDGRAEDKTCSGTPKAVRTVKFLPFWHQLKEQPLEIY